MLKDKLISAVKEAAASYNGGTSANESVVKAADKYDFTVKQAERLCEMFNTAAAINQQRRQDNPTGSCELADKSEVAKALLGTGHEKAASCFVSSPDYSFYSSSPEKTNETMRIRRGSIDSMVKAAYDAGEASKKKPGLDVSQRSLYVSIDNSISMLKSAGDAADDIVRCLGIEIERGVVKIASFAESNQATSDEVDMLKSTCPPEVVKMASNYSARLASSDGGKYKSIAVMEPSKSVEAVLKVAEEVASHVAMAKKYEAKRDSLLKAAAGYKDEMRRIAGLPTSSKNEEPKKSLADMLDFSKVAGNSPFGAADRNEEEATSDVRAILDVASIMKKAGITAEQFENSYKEIEKKAAPLFFSISPDDALKSLSGSGKLIGEEKRMLNARRSMILADLMANDPIISEADPDDVGEAYKTMVMVSPRVSLDKAQVRSFIRSAVNSVAVSPADAKILTDVDKGMNRANVLSLLDSSIKDSNR